MRNEQSIFESCLAVIPARGGSKRIPLKNIREFCGKPIICHTIEAALSSNLFRNVIVSTDNENIAKIALNSGAEVPFLRKADLAGDYTPVSLATLDALEKLDPNGTIYNNVAQMMPNCPLRTNKDITDSYKQFVKTNADSQISVVRYSWLNPWWAMRRNEEFYLEPLFKEQINKRSQDLPDLFCPTGAIWWIKAKVLRREMSFLVDNRKGWEMPWENGIDIDTEDDWRMAELVMQKERLKL